MYFCNLLKSILYSLINIAEFGPIMYRKFIKPFFDFLFALGTLVVLSPLLLIVTVLLAMAIGGNPFFLQRRPGKYGKIFRIVKFRTMTNDKDTNGALLPDAQRLTPIGNLVRKTSIDELPQLINVVKGEMSFIGPRPLLPEYLPLYSPRQSKRHLVRPGISGWAQVNGRNAVSWQEKFEMDVWYVENQSLLLDLKILIKTIKKVIMPEGINSEGQATTERFKGNV